MFSHVGLSTLLHIFSGFLLYDLFSEFFENSYNGYLVQKRVKGKVMYKVVHDLIIFVLDMSIYSFLKQVRG